MKQMTNVSKLELGCGSHKRPGFFGIDKAPSAVTDLVMDIETAPLPFSDDSIAHVYSSHAFEHLDHPSSPIHPLREIVRVCRDGALAEIWTPHGRSNDGLLFGHRNFYTEASWEHICVLYPEFYFGDGNGRLAWERTEYVLFPGVREQLQQLHIPLSFALLHLSNISVEFGVFLRVRKNCANDARHVRPTIRAGYSRGECQDVSLLNPERPGHVEPPLRHRIADLVNETVKHGLPRAHHLVRSIVGKVVTSK